MLQNFKSLQPFLKSFLQTKYQFLMNLIKRNNKSMIISKIILENKKRLLTFSEIFDYWDDYVYYYDNRAARRLTMTVDVTF